MPNYYPYQAYPNMYPNQYPMQNNTYNPQVNVGASQASQQQVSQPVQQQIQNGGFMMVPSEEIVNTYPVAPGNCVTFKIEGKPIVMEKSMGFSQLEAPKIDRYRLVKEEVVTEAQEPHIEPKQDEVNNSAMRELEARVDALSNELEALEEEVNTIRTSSTKKTTASKRKEVTEDDPD